MNALVAVTFHKFAFLGERRPLGCSAAVAQPSVITAETTSIGPRGDYLVGHETWASKLAGK